MNFTRPVLGVILAVNPSDSDKNKTAYKAADRRGYLHTCTVLVVEDGQSSFFVLGNVVITPDARTGLDDYYERLPRGCSGLVTGENWNNQFNNINPYDLDGDWCVVSFLGGSLDNPFILKWWPHPRNPYDAATSGNRNPNSPSSPRYLAQDGRFFHRINGVEFVVTKPGDIYFSTALANSALRFGSPLAPVNGRFPRTPNEDQGGSLKGWIKPSQSFELDWNEQINGLGVVEVPDAEIPQINPPQVGSAVEKQNSYIFADKDRIKFRCPEEFFVASKQRILISSEEDTTIEVGGSYSLNTPIFSVELNESSGQLSVKNKNNGDSLTFDATSNTVSLSATTGLTLTAIGAVNITGSTVTINGRVVRTSSDPI